VPNHTASDHAWVKIHPDYYIEGSEEALANAPQITCGSRPTADPRTWPMAAIRILPVGPTLQLNYANPDLREKTMRST
jgi:hypothetical protein